MKDSVAARFFYQMETVHHDYDAQGFRLEWQWEPLVTAARDAAVEIQKEEGSYDATEYLTFADGSRLMLANPRQAAFAAFARELTPLVQVTRENVIKLNHKYTRKDGDTVYDLEEERAYTRSERGHR
jgi:hypothetical protein